MIFPSIEQLTKNTYNRYELVIATAKAARIITDDLNEQKEEAERNAGFKEPGTNDKMNQIQKEIKDFPEEKPVKSAIQKIFEGEFLIIAE
ncbi:MAG: DNA-directed RNA polymerase subunit omega [Oscillospiraceae bacterium]|nr:DNA-directed RNA polymerase subunit omega [Oscillospiraceae bacterium]